MSSVSNNLKVIDKQNYYYSNGSYELKKFTSIEENPTVAKVVECSRSIHGPISRNEVAKMVEHVELESPTWEAEVKDVLENQRFVNVGINADFETDLEKKEMGMTKYSYVKSYFNWKTAGAVLASTLTFFTPAIIHNYLPTLDKALNLPPSEENENSVSYSGKAWLSGIKYASHRWEEAKVPGFISQPLFSFVGYKGLEALVTEVIQYPATDYKTWTALNLQKYLQDIYPKLIPEQYRNDPVLREITGPDGHLIRSPFYIDNEVELGKIYEEHVLKNILSNQKRLNGKLVCPSDGKTEIQLADVKREELLSDRIELRLLLLDAHNGFKEER